MKEILRGQFDGFVGTGEAARILGLSLPSMTKHTLERQPYAAGIQYIVVAGHRYYVRATVEEGARIRAELAIDDKRRRHRTRG